MPQAESSSVQGLPRPLETTEHHLGYPGDPQQQRVHSRWTAPRRRVLTILQASSDPVCWRRRARIDDCCRFAHVGVTTLGRPVLLTGRCRDRLCPRCSHLRGLECEQRIRGQVTKWDSCRLVTLTLRADGCPLGVRADRLMKSFRRIRRTDLWKRHVRRCAWSIETTYHGSTHNWHVHLHVLTDGEYLPHAQLKKAWETSTGDSTVVDIRAVPNRAAAAKYLSKYVSKPADLTYWPDHAVEEYALGMHRRRLTGFAGKKVPTTSSDAFEPEVRGEVEVALSCGLLVLGKKSGDARCSRVCKVLARTGALWAQFLAEPEPSGPPVESASESADLAAALNDLRQLYFEWSQGRESEVVTSGDDGGLPPDRPKPAAQHANLLFRTPNEMPSVSDRLQ